MFKECTCPECQKTISVPEDQDTCICMFCGAQVRIAEALGETKEIDAVAYGENYNKAMAGMDELIAGCKDPMKGFKKDQYGDSFEAFSTKNRPVYEAAEYVYQCEENPEKWIQKLCQRLIDDAKEDLKKYGFKTTKGQRQMDLNFFISIYVIPSVLKYPFAFSEPFADRLLSDWNAAFKANIGKARFDDIEAGFRKKLCYITTAVCEGLGKGPNCAELCILKQYRDETLLGTVEGRALVEDYYNIAPTIVKRLERQPDRDEVYRELYEEYILPCIHDIEAKDYASCQETYYQMVKKLKMKYMN